MIKKIARSLVVALSLSFLLTFGCGLKGPLEYPESEGYLIEIKSDRL